MFMLDRFKIVFLAIVISLVALIVSLGGLTTREREDSDTLAKIQNSSRLNVCTVVDPPAVIKDAKTGRMSGHFVETAELIASRLGAKIYWIESTFGNIPADLNSRRCDLIAATLFANVPKASSVAFTNPPLFFIGESALVRRDSVFINIDNIYDFDKPDITIAVATGESGDIFVKENFKRAKVRRIDVQSSDLSRFAVEVVSGRADVAISDANTVRLFAEKNPEVLDLFVDKPFGRNPVAWATRQDDYKWKDFISTSLQFLDAQGVLNQLEKKYNAHWIHSVKEYKIL